MNHARPPPAGAAVLLPLGFLALATLFWAGNAVVGRFASEHIPAFTLSFWRWAAATLLLLPFGMRHVWRERAGYMRHWKFFLLISALNVTTYNTLQYWALHWTTAINVGVLGASMPAFIFVLTWLTGEERASGRALCGMFIALAGVLWVLCRGDLGALAALRFNAGDLLMLVAIVSFAFYSVLVRRAPVRVNNTGLLTFQCAAGTVGIVPFYLWDLAGGAGFALNAANIAVVLYVALLPSIAGNLCWIRGVQTGGANLAGLSYNLIPMFISVMAVLFLGEVFAPHHAVGLGAIFAAFYLAVARRRRVKTSTPRSAGWRCRPRPWR